MKTSASNHVIRESESYESIIPWDHYSSSKRGLGTGLTRLTYGNSFDHKFNITVVLISAHVVKEFVDTPLEFQHQKQSDWYSENKLFRFFSLFRYVRSFSTFFHPLIVIGCLRPQ